MNFYFVQEKCITLFGHDPRTIIEPTTKDEFLVAVKNQALEWRDWVTQTRDSLGFQFYAVLTIYRALYALKHGDQVSKTMAAQWAKKAYPQWAGLIEDALNWRTDGQNMQPDQPLRYPEVQHCS